jgi:hypothetical protein
MTSVGTAVTVTVTDPDAWPDEVGVVGVVGVVGEPVVGGVGVVVAGA